MPTTEQSERCVLCGHAGRGDVAPFHMTHGIAVLLCRAHREPRFLRRRRGRIFTERLHAAWRAAGAVNQRRLSALATHQRRMHPAPPKRRRPGSYAWPNLRRLAETRFAAGEAPDTVIRDLRRQFGIYPACVPSEQTMRRWHAEGRWHHTPTQPRPTPGWIAKPTWIRRPRVSRWPHLGFDQRFHPFGIWICLWVDDRPHTQHWRRR